METFVGDVIEELGSYARAHVAAKLRALIELYNERVEAVEIDKSMLVEIPANL